MVRTCNRVKEGLKENQILRNDENDSFRVNTFLFVINGLSFKQFFQSFSRLSFVCYQAHTSQFEVQYFPIKIDLLFLNRHAVVYNYVGASATTAKLFQFEN